MKKRERLDRNMLSFAQMALKNRTHEQLKLYISQSIAIFRILHQEKSSEQRRRGEEQTLFYAMMSQSLLAYRQRNLESLQQLRSEIHRIVDR